MDHQDDQDRATGSAASEQLRPQQQQQQIGQQLEPSETDQTSYGNSAGQQSHRGQAAASDDDSMGAEQERAPSHSTAAQRSGGQSPGGQGMGNESFEGSSLGGQSSADAPTGLFGNGQPDDSSETYIDPTTGQPEEQAKPSDLDGA